MFSLLTSSHCANKPSGEPRLSVSVSLGGKSGRFCLFVESKVEKRVKVWLMRVPPRNGENSCRGYISFDVVCEIENKKRRGEAIVSRPHFSERSFTARFAY